MRVMWLGVMLSAGCTQLPANPENHEVGVKTQKSNNCPPDNPCCSHTPESPIIVDLDGDGLALTGTADGVIWTLYPGESGRWAWTRRGA
jgi:hypothetical protein